MLEQEFENKITQGKTDLENNENKIEKAKALINIYIAIPTSDHGLFTQIVKDQISADQDSIKNLEERNVNLLVEISVYAQAKDISKRWSI